MSKSPTNNNFTEVKDSGQRQNFSTGSVRDTQEGKGRFDLMSPIVAQRDAKHLENGARKYGDRNWEKGQPLSRYLDSAVRHLNKFQEGHRDEDHLAAARWNLGGLIHTEEMILRGLLPKELNDLPNYLNAPATDPYPWITPHIVFAAKDDDGFRWTVDTDGAFLVNNTKHDNGWLEADGWDDVAELLKLAQSSPIGYPGFVILLDRRAK